MQMAAVRRGCRARDWSFSMSETAVMEPQTALDKAVKYAEDVLSGVIVAGKFVKLACQRFKDDLANGRTRGLRMDEHAAERVSRFFERLLHHSKGEWGARKDNGKVIAAKAFHLADWQQFIIANLFGWYKADGTRRFREAHVSVARGNGKTTLISGIGLYMMVADFELKAEIYAVATTEDQAKICWDGAVRMRNASPDLVVYVEKSHKALFVTDTNSTFQAWVGARAVQKTHLGFVAAAMALLFCGSSGRGKGFPQCGHVSRTTWDGSSFLLPICQTNRKRFSRLGQVATQKAMAHSCNFPWVVSSNPAFS